MTDAVTWVADLLHGIVGGALSRPLAYLVLTLFPLVVVLALAPGYIWMMRKIMAHIQARVGPDRVGPFGLLQPVADAVKLLTKEDIVPTHVDKWGWSLAPYVFLVPVLLSFLPLPWAAGFTVANVGTGIVLILALSAVSPLGEILAGWSSNSKYAMLGGLRSAALDVAYEVPLVLAAAGVVLLAGTMETGGIVQAQRDSVWFILLQPIGAFIFFTAGIAKIGIAPLDLPEAESELVAGFHTEYSGMRFAMLFLTLFANVILISALTALLYFGGWSGPFVDAFAPLGLVWFLAKIVAFSAFIFVVWFTLPRIRVDQFLALGWKVLFPLALVNLVLAALEATWLAAGGTIPGLGMSIVSGGAP